MRLQTTVATLQLCIDALHFLLSLLSLLFTSSSKCVQFLRLGVLSLVHGLMRTT